MNLLERIEHTKKYAEAFWQHEMIDRPYVNITASRVYGYDPSAWLHGFNPAGCYKACMGDDPNPFFDAYLDYIDHIYYGGEALPNIDLSIGPDQFAAFFGGTIEASYESGTTWVKPFVDDLEDYEPVLDRSENGYYSRLQRFLAAGAKKAEGHFLLDMLDLHGNMDALSPMRGSVELCCDIMDCPEDVHRVLNTLEEYYKEFYEMAFKTCNMEKYGSIGWQPTYCAGRSVALQCDFSCLISPEQGREFVFPYVEREASLMDHCMYHLDGKEALCHLDRVLEMEDVECVQWVPGAGQPRTMHWMDVLHKIQDAGKAVWIYDWNVDEIKTFHKELQPDKVVYTVIAGSPQEGEDLLEFLRKNT